MPNFDRTGPTGQGSRTGRQMGKCNPDNKEKDSDEVNGRGAGNRNSTGVGRGLGKGIGRGPGRGLGRGPGRGR